MEEKKRLPDAELAVMQAVWAQSGEVGRADIEGALTSHGWSANTLNTYLTRLCRKGFSHEPPRRTEQFGTPPLVSRDKYLEFESRSVLKRLYGGRLAALSPRSTPSSRSSSARSTSCGSFWTI